MRTLSKDEIVDLLSESNDPHIKVSVDLINRGIDLATALTIGIVSLSVERDGILQETNENYIQKNIPKTNDLS